MDTHTISLKEKSTDKRKSVSMFSFFHGRLIDEKTIVIDEKHYDFHSAKFEAETSNSTEKLEKQIDQIQAEIKAIIAISKDVTFKGVKEHVAGQSSK